MYFVFLLCSYMRWILMVLRVHFNRPPQNVNFLYPIYRGRNLDILRRPIESVISGEMIISTIGNNTHFEGDPTISEIGNVPLQNIQRVGPQPKLSLNHHHYLYLARQNSKLQSTLLHQRFICY